MRLEDSSTRLINKSIGLPKDLAEEDNIGSVAIDFR